MSFHNVKLESSSTGSSFPADSAKPVPLAGYSRRLPALVEFLHFDIQSTGQKSHCVNTTFWPSQCYVLIRQSDSPCPYQF
ncbi:hypothetical protein BO70DRAFT_375777 [Aspergillus heteromorphus CBS 117.55]|uniref:Uncharacterized protein n=1 Tax=Aspergillus heteromorphus CBS 117.55 TaxID=1448321 RepID=A0A317UN21_9EURO|nr:hypothetical protein BO70DRAFT_375777 [Aspergillus heteromorphus CBS 117.55]